MTQFAFVLVRHYSYDGDLNKDLAVAERDRLNKGEMPDACYPETLAPPSHGADFGDQSLLDHQVWAYPVNPPEVKA